MLATKLRALLQRDKGRDLIDLAHALEVFENLQTHRVVETAGLYLAEAKQSISRADAERRMFQKLVRPRFLMDVRPLLAVQEAENLTDGAIKRAFERVLTAFVAKIPGKPWARTDEMCDRFELGRSLDDGAS